MGYKITVCIQLP